MMAPLSPDESLFEKRLKEKGLSEAEIARASEELLRIGAQFDEPGADIPKIYDQCLAFIERFGLTMDDVAYGDGAVTHEEFQQAYKLLVDVLAPYGRNSSADDAAYFIVDDNYGTRELLVEVINPRIDWPGAKRAIAERLAQRLRGWAVIVRASGAPDEQIKL